jgi:hypothetical protein
MSQELKVRFSLLYGQIIVQDGGSFIMEQMVHVVLSAWNLHVFVRVVAWRGYLRANIRLLLQGNI